MQWSPPSPRSIEKIICQACGMERKDFVHSMHRCRLLRSGHGLYATMQTGVEAQVHDLHALRKEHRPGSLALWEV